MFNTQTTLRHLRKPDSTGFSQCLETQAPLSTSSHEKWIWGSPQTSPVCRGLRALLGIGVGHKALTP